MSKKQHPRHHIDKRLQFRLQLYIVISIIIIGILLFDVITRQAGFLSILVGFIIGLLIGVIAARTYKLSWHKDLRKVISRLDVFGIIILLFYIGFALGRQQLVAYFVHGAAIGPVSLSIVVGTMLGRVFGIGRNIQKILREEDII